MPGVEHLFYSHVHRIFRPHRDAWVGCVSLLRPALRQLAQLALALEL